MGVAGGTVCVTAQAIYSRDGGAEMFALTLVHISLLKGMKCCWRLEQLGLPRLQAATVGIFLCQPHPHTPLPLPSRDACRVHPASTLAIGCGTKSTKSHHAELNPCV